MSLKDAFAGMRAVELDDLQNPVPMVRESTPAPQPKAAPVKKSSVRRDVPAYTRPERAELAKSVDPDFEPAKIYVRKATRKKAWRRWEDEEGGDFSDLVQHLLEQYLGT